LVDDGRPPLSRENWFLLMPNIIAKHSISEEDSYNFDVTLLGQE
jgi:hypothetical protein